MFAGTGSRHQHDGKDCTCRDLIETVAIWQTQGKTIPDAWIEPEKVEFPGFAYERFLGLPFLTPALTVEEWIVRIWQDVRRGCTVNGFAPAKITWNDLIAYEKFTGCALPSWIVRSLFVFDEEFLRNYRPDEVEAPRPIEQKAPSRPTVKPPKRK